MKTALLALLLAVPAAAQTKDSLVSSRADTTFGPVRVTYTNVYVRVPVDTTTPPVTPPSGGGNLATMTFESGTFEGLTDGGGGKPVNGLIASSGCYAGSKCFDVNIAASANDAGGSGYWVGSGASYSDLWASFALNIVKNPMQGGVQTQKLLIFRNGGSQGLLGEFVSQYGAWIWSWLFTEGTQFYPSGMPNPAVPGWHRYKVHFHCAAPATVSVGVDGAENVWVQKTKAGGGCASLPTTITFGGTLNAGSGASHFQFDNIKIGTTDPGWP